MMMVIKEWQRVVLLIRILNGRHVKLEEKEETFHFLAAGCSEGYK
jgi:hypothetical protein